MTDYKRKPSEKIVRDKTVAVAMEHEGIKLTINDWRYCTANEAVWFLLQRLKEEADTFLLAKNKDERVDKLVDLTEIVFSLTAHHGFPIEMIADFAAAKREDLGTFDNNLIVEFDKLKKENT